MRKISLSHIISIVLIVFFSSFENIEAASEIGYTNYRLSIGVRRHSDNVKSLDFLPFSEPNLSTVVFYELHQYEEGAFWQFGVGYADSPEGDIKVTHVLTPQLNLIIKKANIRMGIGGLKSKISTYDKDWWTDIYGQLIAGMNFPLQKRLSIDFNMYYIFGQWGHLTSLNSNNLDFGLLLNYRF
ncbi:MAG: hypothetical protein HQK76_13420 [Desulfobacterales bacterium]|nr:hypothetical protein [Desulfobacterales bacterium]